MPTLDVRFGSYVFGNEIDTLEIENESRVNQAAVPRRNGLLSDEAYAGGLRIRIGGLIGGVGEDADDVRSTLNSLKNAFNQGKQLLRIWNDREVEAQKSYFMARIGEGGDMTTIEWEAELVADEPVFRSVNETEQEETITSSPETNTFANNGNADAPVVIRITAGSSTIASGLRIDNETTGEYFTINEEIAIDDWIEIDTDLLTVVDQDGTNKISVFAQDFFKLAAGDNSVKWTGTATGSPKIKITYRDRYDGF